MSKVDREYKNFLAYLIAEMAPIVCPEYKVELRLEFANCEDDDEYQTCYAEARMDTTYLRVEVVVYAPLYELWEAREYEEISAIICHELVHVPLQTLVELTYTLGEEDDEELIRVEMERSVSRLTSMAQALGWAQLKPQTKRKVTK